MTLTYTQLARFKAQLEQRYYELRNEISRELLASDDQQYIDLAGRVRDTGEASVADMIKDVDHAIVGLHIDEIRAIDVALMRIAHETYGICTDCDDAIELERLQAQPTALRCYRCQEKLEKKPAGEAGSGPAL